MNVKITADSTCDLPKALLESYDIAVIPLYVLKAGTSYRDGVDIAPADIFRYVEETGDFCTTAAVNTYDYVSFFKQFSNRYDAVIHISLGSGFSLSHTNATAAARLFHNVTVIDSKNLSSGQGLVVLAAARMASAGSDAVTITERLADVIDRVETSFLLERLDYIFKGGRCSLATALGADILHLNTCVEVKNGKMQVTKKYRGAFAGCADAYVRDRLGGRQDLNTEQIFITHPAAPREAVEAARTAIRQTAVFDEITETQAGCTISCHCGPKTLGILFLRR
jgi:DegV family protein with EDD domain